MIKNFLLFADCVCHLISSEGVSCQCKVMSYKSCCHGDKPSSRPFRLEFLGDKSQYIDDKSVSINLLVLHHKVKLTCGLRTASSSDRSFYRYSCISSRSAQGHLHIFGQITFFRSIWSNYYDPTRTKLT